MLLAIDAGNTNVVFAVYDGDERRGLWRASTHQPRTADDYAVWLTSLMQMRELESADITDAVICSVVPQALYDLRRLCRSYFDAEPLIVDRNIEPWYQGRHRRTGQRGRRSDCQCGWCPRELWWPSDRHRFRHPGRPLMSSTKTALIVAVLLRRGSNLSLDALHLVSAQLPRIEVARPKLRDRRRHRIGNAVWNLLGLCGADRGIGSPD